MVQRYCALGALVGAVTGCAVPPLGQARSPDPRGLIDTAVIGAHARFLASDLLQGRRAGSTGARLAAEYIAAVCHALGLEAVGGAYFQSVPLVETSIRSGTLAVTTDAGRLVFESPRDFVADLGSAASLTGFDGPAVFVKKPLAPSADIRGAVVVAEEIGDRGALDTLEARGAVGLVIAVSDGRRYELYARSRGETRLTLADGTVATSLLRTLPTVVVGPAVASALPGPGAPGGVRVELTLDVVRTSTPDRNVACLRPGNDPRARDTAIVFTAHFDHLGVGLPDARGDSVYNGFSDNAAGVAMVLGIAAATGRADRAPRHSMLFLFFTAEEQGLLGSDYYTAQPIWPLDRTRAVINLDAGAPPAPPSSWRLAGTVGSELAHLAVDVALARGWSATVTAATPNSDHFPFLRAGVPAVFIIPGPGPYEGMSMDSSRTLKARWEAYHQPGDEWSPVFPLAGLARYAEYAWLIAGALDRPLTGGGERSAWRGRERR